MSGFLSGSNEWQRDPMFAPFAQNTLDLASRNQGSAFIPTDLSQIMSLYNPLFTLQNQRAFGQAKESAGNLTGSGLGNILGRSAQEQSTLQNQLIAGIMEGRLANNQQMWSTLAQLLTPGAQGQLTHTPGVLDYMMQGAGIALPAIAMMSGSGGAGAGAAGKGATA